MSDYPTSLIMRSGSVPSIPDVYKRQQIMITGIIIAYILSYFIKFILSAHDITNIIMIIAIIGPIPVSYTHLDVYKRQDHGLI